MKKLIFSTLMLTFLIAGGSSAGNAFVHQANADEEEPQVVKYEVGSTLYEFDEHTDYTIDDSHKVNSFTFGPNKLGSLSISGDLTQKTTFRNTEAYGTRGSIQISYSYDGSYQTETNTDWNIIQDISTSVDGHSMDGSVSRGALLIQKSTDGQVWEDVGVPIVNFYETNKEGVENLYTGKGADISDGIFYKFIFAYEMGRKVGENGFWIFKTDVFEYVRCAEVYTFYVCNDVPDFTLNDLSVKDSDLVMEGITVETLRKGETLVDGETTIRGFKVDTLGKNLLVGISKNGGPVQYVSDGHTETNNGRYDITSTTKLGTKMTQTIYVFNGGNNKGYSTYFGDSHIIGERVFRYFDYPTYARGAIFHVNEISIGVPALTGEITNVTTKESIILDGTKRVSQNFSLTPGVYVALLYSGNSNGGSFYQYQFIFNVLDEDAIPFVNYDNLNKTNRVCDLNSKHYEVAYQTTKGGYVFVCFSMDSYTSAFSYAYEIEKRFIESTEDGLYYKSPDNPNVKVKYYDYYEMTSVLNYYAKQNVEINYFNQLDAFTYQTYNNDLLDNLESLNLTSSIKVFPNAEEREKATSRLPYLNGFSFISVGDYDSISVTAYCHANGKTYDLEYTVEVDKQLTTTSKYTIEETNIYGKKRSYDAYFVNENKTKTTWLVSDGGVEDTVVVDNSSLVDNKYTINGDSVVLKSVSNIFDNDNIVTIKAPDVYTYEIKCLSSELCDVAFYKAGSYDLTFIDRTGNSYHVIINISGAKRYFDVFTSSNKNKTYTEVFNDTHIQPVAISEEIMFDATDLKAAIDREVDANLYTNKSYSQYLEVLNSANEVYSDQNSSQETINDACKALTNAYDSLVLKTDKTALKDEIDKFENLIEVLYTPNSYSELKQQYEIGKQVYLEEDPSYESISDAIAKMQRAYNKLILKGDKTDLFNVISMVYEIDPSIYTPNTVNSLKEVFETCLQIYEDDNALQDDIDNATALLISAVGKLVKHADFSQLLDGLNQALKLDKDLYTKESWMKLVESYNYASSIYKDFNSLQNDIDEALAKLKTSISGLVKAGDSSSLKKVIDGIDLIDPMLYSNEDIENLKAKYTEAVEAINDNETQAVLDTLESELKTLVGALKVRPEKQELKDVLDAYSELDKTNLSEEQAKELEAAYKEALELYNSGEATEEQIRAASRNLNSALSQASPNSGAFEWWQILIFVVVALICLVIGSGVLAGCGGQAWTYIVLWVICGGGVIPLCILHPLAWWICMLIDIGAIVVLTIVMSIISANA